MELTHLEDFVWEKQANEYGCTEDQLGLNPLDA
jgi:hypothetical protein